LDRELEKICSFYQLKELEVVGELDHIIKEEANAEQQLAQSEEVAANTDANASTAALPRPPTSRTGRSASVFKSLGLGKKRRSSTLSSRVSDDSDDEEERRLLKMTRSIDMGKLDHNRDDYQSDFRSSKRRSSLFEDYNDMAFSVLFDTTITLKKSIISVYVQLCELRSFIQLNRTGFTKVLKKYDKIMDRKLKQSYLDSHVAPAYPFQPSTIEKLGSHISHVEGMYAKLFTSGNIEESKRELRLHLREHVVWERNTVCNLNL